MRISLDLPVCTCIRSYLYTCVHPLRNKGRRGGETGVGNRYIHVYVHEKTISGGTRQAKRSLDSAVSSLLALISREYAQLV